MRVRIDAGVADITFTRPTKLNAMNAGEWIALRQALATAERDPSVRLVVLRGEGRAFCAGNDLTELARFNKPEPARRYLIEEMLPVFEALACSPLPVIAVVQGLAYGGGLELVQFSDLVAAADTARFSLPEARVGVWATVFCGAAPYTCGPRAAKFLGLTGRSVSAVQAQAMGLVDVVAAESRLDTVVDNLVRSVLATAPASMTHTKRFANRELVTRGLPAVREALELLVAQTLFSTDTQEGLHAFLAKRTPTFPGRREVPSDADET